ncbi:hypothetical protein X737_35870 [Mesorhizobium sp. L48C026A00]|nr:hypothetical protein X737_35870 [Mesorhizobium sp. L48C026A00]
MYFGIRSLIDETDIGSRFDFVAVDMRDLDALRTAVGAAPTGLVWIETPSNPLELDNMRSVVRERHDTPRGQLRCRALRLLATNA